MKPEIQDPDTYIRDFVRAIGQDLKFDDHNATWYIAGEEFGITKLVDGDKVEWLVESYRSIGGTYYDPPDVDIIEHGAFSRLEKALRMVAFLLVMRAFDVANEGEVFLGLES